MKKTYLPLGCDQQGRLESGRFVPDDIPTEPADLEAEKQGMGMLAWLLIGLGLVVGLPLVWHMVARVVG